MIKDVNVSIDFPKLYTVIVGSGKDQVVFSDVNHDAMHALLDRIGELFGHNPNFPRTPVMVTSLDFYNGVRSGKSSNVLLWS